MQRALKRDAGLTARIILCFAILAVIYFIFLSVLAYLGVGGIALIAIGVFMVLLQYFASDKIVLWSTGAKIVSREQYPKLHEIVDRLVARTGMKKPRIAVMHSNIPNAFATGKSQSSAIVAVTTGLLNLLDEEELEGVIAHELAHIKNRDMLAITMASLFSTVAWYVMHFGWYGSMGYGYGRRDNAGGMAIVIIVALITWLVSFLITRAISRYREFVADRDGAIITGKPIKLANALMKISGKMRRIPSKDLREVESLNAFFIIPAMGDSLANIFATHPPVEERIKRLMAMEEKMY
ncbi:MAG: zinc metalloprotease HtpX [Candidatus Nitrosothermus koennekii]|nr:MAG: zinc metalloprotease HtpX [Candidatus Nitrosothermus koennekii]